MKHFLLIFLLFLIFVDPVLAAAPSIPENFEANISGTTVNISWDESTDTENDSIVYNWVLVNSTGYENITHTVRNESMVLYIHFNDGTSTDWSLYGNNGTDTNISYVSDEKYGYVVDFDGYSSKINCGNDNSLDVPIGTFESKFNTNTTQDIYGGKIIEIGEYSNRIGIMVWGDNKFHLFNRLAGVITINIYSPWSVVNGIWNHGLGTWGVSGAEIYINGEEVDSETGDQTMNFPTKQTYIGVEYAGGNRFYEGLLDNSKIYNISLNTTQVNANSNIIVESASYDNFTGVISNLSYGDYHIIVNARDNSTYSDWSVVYNFSITQPPGLFKATFKLIDQYRSDLVYNAYINGTYITDFNITDAYFVNTTNDTSITLTASKNYLDITNLNNVRFFLVGILGFVLLVAFLYMAFKIGRGR